MTDHRTAAVKTLGYIRQAYEDSRSTALASEATAHALLYLGDQVRALVELQRPTVELLAPVDADQAETVDEYDDAPHECDDNCTPGNCPVEHALEFDATLVRPGSESDPDVAYERDVIDAANGL
ncbi:hypothetical protein [Nocardia abscessus]|uniref:hypothetical protein n=1 Tax=Nocardia abscessus TaxID=120957 RepID=UPI002454E7AB|nr:hypothetical protein [Nocardia abscessus]